MSSGIYTQQDFNDELNDLELGLKAEQKCLEFYQRSLDQIANSGVQALYRWFVNASQKRIATLEAIHAASSNTSSWTTEVAGQAETADVSFESAPAFDADADSAVGPAEIMSLREAVELEKKTASVYHTAVQRSRDKSVRALWRYLAASEEAHKQRLDSYFDGIMQLAMKNKKKKRR
jgi:rubrerythrin